MSAQQCYGTQYRSRVQVRGAPSDEELAALIAVLAGLASTAATPPQVPRSAWADPAHRLRIPLRPSSGGWRASALPSG
ncbi:MAG: acyl-CoA carboxylase subunit epsilon [Actinomycetota bacterium]|nr:acyl-CoA carboxylase subunit epsilon [Actinomycetota bacterium]